MATELKKITELPTKASVDLANDYAVITNGESTNRIQLQKIINETKAVAQNVNTDGMLVHYYTNTDGAMRVAPIDSWKSSFTHLVVGIGFLHNGVLRTVSLDDFGSRHWSSSTIQPNGVMSAKRAEAIADLSGRINTDAMLTKPECSNIELPAGLCNAYSKLDGNNKGLGAGSWHLPSVGEAMLMLAIKSKLNYAISLFGGTPISSVYWTSSQANEQSAWFVDFSNGNIGYTNKLTGNHKVRPINVFA